MRSVQKRYTNGEITVLWKSASCIHSGECFTNLPKVFKPSETPWIDMSGASTEDIIKVVNMCPTDALSFEYNKDTEEKKESDNQTKEPTQKPVSIKMIKNGPLQIDGNVNIYDTNGKLIREANKCWLCRCGGSNNAPFCDGQHIKINFQDK